MSDTGDYIDLMKQPQPLPLLSSEDAPIIAPIMSTAYWMSQGFDEPTARGMESFQCELAARKSIYAHVIHLKPMPNIDSIPHHDMLVPHWQKYLKNLAERGRAKSFHVEKFQLQHSLDVIVPSLMHMSLAELGLCKCSIDRNGLLMLSKFLSRNTTLKRLLLNENQIQDVHVAGALSFAVKNHPKLEELCMSKCGVGNNACVLPEILSGCSKLKVLRLTDNNIGSANISDIRVFLAANPNLTSLRLDKNLLSDADASQIVDALRTNSNLHYLYLKGNADITEDGKMETMKAVVDTRSLNSIADANHKCEIVYNTPVVTSNINDKFWNNERKVQSKILLALYGMDTEKSAVQYFNHVPVELISHGLALIQKDLDCFEQHDATFRMVNAPGQALGRLYDFLRVWNLPWLFSNGRHEAASKRIKTSHTC